FPWRRAPTRWRAATARTAASRFRLTTKCGNGGKAAKFRRNYTLTFRPSLPLQALQRRYSYLPSSQNRTRPGKIPSERAGQSLLRQKTPALFPLCHPPVQPVSRAGTSLQARPPNRRRRKLNRGSSVLAGSPAPECPCQYFFHRTYWKELTW